MAIMDVSDWCMKGYNYELKNLCYGPKIAEKIYIRQFSVSNFLFHLFSAYNIYFSFEI